MADKDLLVTVSWLLGRRVSAKELMEALNMSRSAYYQQKERGVITCMDNLVAIADHFGLDKVDLFLRYGHLTQADLAAHIGNAPEVAVMDPPRRAKRTRIPKLPQVRRSDAPPL